MVVLALPACDEFECGSEFDFDGARELEKGKYAEVDGKKVYCFDDKFFGHSWLKIRHVDVSASAAGMREKGIEVTAEEEAKASANVENTKRKLYEIYNELIKP